jgi:hypothetical protein
MKVESAAADCSPGAAENWAKIEKILQRQR